MPGEEIPERPLAPLGASAADRKGIEALREIELARADAAAADDSDIDDLPAPALVCPICGLGACGHNLPYVEKT